MSKGGNQGQQTTVSKTELPGWVQDAGQRNLNMAYNVSQNMLGPYTGERYAGMTDGAKALVAGATQNVGSSNPAFGAAMSTAAGAGAYNPLQVNPGSIAQTDLSRYMNPFTDQVIGSGLKAIDMQRQQALNSNADQAISQKAFGGSRQGVQEGVTNAAAALQAGNLASGLQAQNFGNALQMAGQDVSTNLQGQIANQNADLSGAATRLSGANTLGSLAGQQQSTYLGGLMAALQGQSLAQADKQGQINAKREAYMEAQQFPLQQLQIPLQALGMTPYGSTTTQTSQLPPSNGMMQGLGAGLGILGSLGGMFGAGGAFPMVGAASLLK